MINHAQTYFFKVEVEMDLSCYRLMSIFLNLDYGSYYMKSMFKRNVQLHTSSSQRLKVRSERDHMVTIKFYHSAILQHRNLDVNPTSTFWSGWALTSFCTWPLNQSIQNKTKFVAFSLIVWPKSDDSLIIFLIQADFLDQSITLPDIPVGTKIGFVFRFVLVFIKNLTNDDFVLLHKSFSNNLQKWYLPISCLRDLLPVSTRWVDFIKVMKLLYSKIQYI